MSVDAQPTASDQGFQSPVYVRNMHGGPTVLSDPSNNSQYITWMGAGDTNGEDVQIVSRALIHTVQFLRNVQRGIFVIENIDENPDIKNAIERQNASWSQRQSRVAQTAEQHIEQEANKDLVSITCVGPDNRGIGQCGVEVPIRDQDLKKTPPLCSQHITLRDQFVPTETVEGNKTVTKWIRSALGARESQI